MDTLTWIGFSTQYRDLPGYAKDEIFEYRRAFDSPFTTVIDEIKFAHQLLEDDPNKDVIIRLTDIIKEISPKTLDESLFRFIPASLLGERYLHALGGDKRFIIYGGNEPQPPHFRECLEWQIELAEWAIENDCRVVVLNSSVGTFSEKAFYAPPEGEEDSDVRDLIEKLILLSANHPDQVYIGLHEYFPENWEAWWPWLIGGFTFWLHFCDKRGLPYPSFIFTEWMFEKFNSLGGIGDGSKDMIHRLGAKQAADIVIAVYKRLIETPGALKAIKGICIFTYGDDSKDAQLWGGHNIVGETEFLNYLLGNIPFFEIDRPVTEPPPGGNHDTITISRSIWESVSNLSKEAEENLELLNATMDMIDKGE